MHRNSLTSLLVALAATGALAAQNTLPIAYPQNGTDGSSGQIVPLGYSSSSTNFDEGRWMQLIPARYLPSTGGAMFGLDVLSQASNTTVYPTLTITMSHAPPGSTLSSTFAQNMPTPVVVFAHTNHAITWTARQWQTIPLDQPFVYDGFSDLVVDIQKTFDRVATPPTGLGHHQTTSNPGRADLPLTRYHFGPLGSGAATAVTANYSTRPMKMRFQFVGLPTFLLTGTRGGSNNNIFSIGHQFDATLTGTPGALYGSLVSFGWLSRPFPVPGIGGFVLIDLPTAVAYAGGPIGTSGIETVTWSIPNDPSLVTATLAFQGVSQDGGNAIVMTNATDCIIND